jgi:hypothetical protein
LGFSGRVEEADEKKNNEALHLGSILSEIRQRQSRRQENCGFIKSWLPGKCSCSVYIDNARPCHLHLLVLGLLWGGRLGADYEL